MFFQHIAQVIYVRREGVARPWRDDTELWYRFVETPSRQIEDGSVFRVVRGLAETRQVILRWLFGASVVLRTACIIAGSIDVPRMIAFRIQLGGVHHNALAREVAEIQGHLSKSSTRAERKHLPMGDIVLVHKLHALLRCQGKAMQAKRRKL
jgi:hypothetical protein